MTERTFSARVDAHYLLRPPEHGQLLLANAQAQWLSSAKAASEGWGPVMRAGMAQTEANRGNLVVVVFANPDQHEPGHPYHVRFDQSVTFARPERAWRRGGGTGVDTVIIGGLFALAELEPLAEAADLDASRVGLSLAEEGAS